jgi:hypothetical protein
VSRSRKCGSIHLLPHTPDFTLLVCIPEWVMTLLNAAQTVSGRLMAELWWTNTWRSTGLKNYVSKPVTKQTAKVTQLSVHGRMRTVSLSCVRERRKRQCGIFTSVAIVRYEMCILITSCLSVCLHLAVWEPLNGYLQILQWGFILILPVLFNIGNQQRICRVWGSHSGHYEQLDPLGYNAVYSVENQPTFRRNVSVDFQRATNHWSQKI